MSNPIARILVTVAWEELREPTAFRTEKFHRCYQQFTGASAVADGRRLLDQVIAAQAKDETIRGLGRVCCVTYKEEY